MSTLIGSMPTGWTEARLRDICTLIPGAATHDDPDGLVPVLKPRNLVAGRLVGPTDRMSAQEAAQRPRYQVQSGDILCARTGSIGRVGLATADQKGWVSALDSSAYGPPRRWVRSFSVSISPTRQSRTGLHAMRKVLQFRVSAVRFLARCRSVFHRCQPSVLSAKR